jgi:hypothetical protein
MQIDKAISVMKQQLEKELDNLIAAQKASTFFGRLKLFSVLKRARTRVKYDDYVALENKVVEAIKASGADALIKKFKLNEDVKGHLLKAENAEQMSIIARELAFKAIMANGADQLIKKLNLNEDVKDDLLKAENAEQMSIIARELAFKTIMGKAKTAKTAGVDLSKMSKEETLRFFFEHEEKK